VRVGRRRCALYGRPIYLEGDGAGLSFGYGFYRFYRDGVMLRAQPAHNPTRSYIHEAVVPVIVDVDVGHVTDKASPGVEDAPLAKFALGRTRVLRELKPDELHVVLPCLGR